MPRIRIILEDDEGNPIPQAQQRIYQLEGDCENLDEIERAVEGFKRRALPEVEHSLLARAQERFVAARGGNRRLLRLNGTERIRIKTIHGGFEFAERRFLLPDGSSCRYLKRTGQEPVGVGKRDEFSRFCIETLRKFPEPQAGSSP